ncbi:MULTISPECIES: menaquinol-cytochrome c reductase cytochrome b/c subunit [unclassified Paenibacillus]|uniref:menaquinol-cytochrome c reductase cytochrome b/c subunit n=1 Tax=unclassified Paenibacillus TaxID=185978 RepID=UPI001C10D3EC|nr:MULTISPECIES: menaquinol-cytochrome c reductase cytochrome b/c subunit [unclassified Paenibacillus]MBU5443992.1 c-type cytochrome [Paenibacillus sp. MSJ-34]CAH0118773.1 Cytochrome b6-f complex subunit 4 [Paenibacillus sp. CECT 9249]
MAHGHKSNEKVVFVGDSRVRVRTNKPEQPDYRSFPGKSEAFIPNFLLKEWMVGVVVLVGFLVLTISEPAPLGFPADPNAAFIPIPDWYFLFLYQFLKFPYASGDFIVIGTVLVPGVAFGALVLAPFLDTGKERRFYRRPIASSLMFLGLISLVYLTSSAWGEYQEELSATGIKPEHITREEQARENFENGLPTSSAKKPVEVAIVEPDDPAMEYLKTATCLACHGNDLKGTNGAPALRGVGDKHSKEEILKIIHEGSENGKMPAMYDIAVGNGLTDDQIDHLAEWLAKQKKA